MNATAEHPHLPYAPSNARVRGGLWLPLVALAIIASAVVAVDRAFVREGRGGPDMVGERSEKFADGYVEIRTEILGIDPVDSRMHVELNFEPHGRFAGPDNVLAVPIEVDVTDVNGAEPIKLAAGRRLVPYEAVIDLYDGESEDYPFDSHKAVVEVLATEMGAGGLAVPAPVELVFGGHHHGFALTDTPRPTSSHGYVGFDLNIKRSKLVIGTAIACMLVMWGMVLVNCLLLWMVLVGQMKIDLSLFVYLSGFIVATYFFRQILPDTPPYVGLLSDYLAFFWVELISAAILVVLAVLWFRESKLVARS